MPPQQDAQKQKKTNTEVPKIRPGLKTFISYLKQERKDLAWSAIIFLIFITYGLTNRNWGNAYDLTIDLDSKIPLIPATIFLYHLWAPSLLLVLLYLFIKNRQNYRAMLSSTVVAGLLGFSTFILFTTYIPRPEIRGNDFSALILKLTYLVDQPYSGFPSFHVLTTCIYTYFFLITSKSRTAQYLMLLWSVVICATTVTTKQHVILDIVGGLIYSLPSLIIGIRLERYICQRLQRKSKQMEK